MAPSDAYDRPKKLNAAGLGGAGGGGAGRGAGTGGAGGAGGAGRAEGAGGAGAIPLVGDEVGAAPVGPARGSGAVGGAAAGSRFGSGTSARAGGGRVAPAAFGPARPVAARHVDPAWARSAGSGVGAGGGGGAGIEVEYEEEEEPVAVAEKLRLRWWAFAAAVVGVVAASGAKAAYDPPVSAYAIGAVVGTAIGVLVIPTVMGLIVYAATRRKAMPANAVFAGLCLLVGLGNGIGEVVGHRKGSMGAAMDKVAALQRDVEEEMKSAAKHGDPDPDAAKDFADRSYYILRELGAAADDETNAVLTAAANRVHQILQLNYELTLRFNESRTNETLSLKRGGKQRDLKEAINEIAELENWVRHVHKFTGESADAIRQELRGKKVPEQVVSDSIRRVMESIQIEDFLKLRKLDMEILAGTRELFVLLQNTYGTWTYDEIKDRFEFASEDTLRKFEAIGRRIAEATVKEVELEAAMRDAARRQLDLAKRLIRK